MASSLWDISDDRPLAEVIAAVTRPAHAKLNKLIVAQLPLALPPHASDPSAYVSGLLHIAAVYTTFESLWQNILDTPPTSGTESCAPNACDPDSPLLDPESTFPPTSDHHESPREHNPLVCNRLHSMLLHLHLPGLTRSQRLKADIGDLTGWPEHVVEEQLRVVSQMSRLGGFTSHIKRSIESKPHVLLAYSYILFMALFAGGRFIRASLESAGAPFWEQVPSPIKPVSHACEQKRMRNKRACEVENDQSASHGRTTLPSHDMPLRFFHFATPMDGEDLKREFKKRLSESEDILTAREKHDIVQEAVCIFDNMSVVVHQLENVCSESTQGDSELEGPLGGLAGLMKNSVAGRFRDSVAVAKERRARSSSRKSSTGGKDAASSFKSPENAKSVANSPLENTDSIAPHAIHRAVPGIAGIELCPGLPKSMRFEKALAKPVRLPEKAREAGAELVGCLESATKRVYDIHATNWVMMAAFGVMILGVVLTGRRGVVEAL